jgi:S-adenosylmethionine:tRNA ribosyltransferase-isomerase
MCLHCAYLHSLPKYHSAVGENTASLWGTLPVMELLPSQLQHSKDQWLESYDYQLPEECIAQTPVEPRDSARLMVIRRDRVQDSIFRDLPQFLRPGDLLVLNNTRVIPARLLGSKLDDRQPSPGAKVEVLLLEPKPQDCWLALVKPGRKLKPGTLIGFGPGPEPTLKARILAVDAETHGRLIQFLVPTGTCFEDLLAELGQVPLPPYIHDQSTPAERYQTVYAQASGSAAAPTAGLHFTPTLLDTLQNQGIQQAFVTLHVGLGTFRPVEAEKITEHQIHAEWVNLPVETVEAIQQTQARGGRIIAVGTTALRTLEGVATQMGSLQPYQGKVNLFIYPGYQRKVIDGLITNFHLPRSSLLMLVSALIGRERLLALYAGAIAQQYRFFSFGDAMLILPEACL